MKFWKFVKDIVNMPMDEQNQGDSANDGSSEEQNNEKSNQSEQQSAEQNQGNSSNDESSEEQSNEVSNQSQQSGEQNQGNSSNAGSSEEQSNEVNNQSQQSGEQNQSDSSNGGSSEEQSNEVSNQSGQQSAEQNQGNSSNGGSSEEQSNEVSNQSGQQGDEQNQGNSSNAGSSEEQNDEVNNQAQQSSEQNQGNSSNDGNFEEQNNEMNNQSQQSSEKNQSDSSNNQESIRESDCLNSDGLEKENYNDIKEKKDQLKQLRDKLLDYANKKQDDEKQSIEKSKLNTEKKEPTETKEEKYELSEQTNEFLNQLGELPHFENRDRGPGYSIDTESYTEIPDSLIRTLITKFLNQRFCKKTSDLNVRSNSLEKSRGFYKWEVKDVITHLETHQITKVLSDKYGYQYAQGKNENVPLSFYFDLSGSMSNYTNMLAVISIELLKKGVKVLVGFNERVNVQIESVNANIDIETFARILDTAGLYFYDGSLIDNTKVNYKYIGRNLDNYLINKGAEKCVVFADFDPKREVENLSQFAQVYWFCFESEYKLSNLENYRGFVYPVKNIKDIANGLIKVNDKRFETLCYTENPKTLKK